MDETRENRKKDKIRAIGVSLVGLSVIIFFLANSSIFFTECEKGLQELYRTAEIEATYSEEFELAYQDYFITCESEYSMIDQIEINQKISEIIREAKQVEDV